MEHRQDVCWQHSRRGFGHVVSPVSEPSTGDASCSNWNKFSLFSSQTWTCGSPVPRQGIKGARHPFLQGTAPLSQPSVKALVSPHKMFFPHFASLYRTAGLFGVVLVVYFQLMHQEMSGNVYCTGASTSPGEFTQWSRALVWAAHPGLAPALPLTHCGSLVES